MNRSMGLAGVLASLLVVGACASPDANAEPPPAAEAPPEPVITGGFGSATDTPELKSARDLAIAELYKQFPTRALVETVTSEVQVVAGLNYRFRIEMSGDPAQRPTYDAVVYRNLQGKMSVTSVTRVTD